MNNSYIFVHIVNNLDAFQRNVNRVAEQGYRVHTYTCTASVDTDGDRPTTFYTYTACMEREKERPL